MQSITRRVLLAIVLLISGVQLASAERTTTYLHTDGLGSVVAATNQSGAVLWRKTYAPFGEQTDTQADNERLSYTGKPHDDAIGLTYFGGRYYDPAIGRFASVDPVGFVESNPMSFNRYLYVNNNPYKYVDPDGEFLNFAAKFVLDVGINIAFNYATTGSFGVGAALKESVTGLFNPAKTLAKAGKLLKVMSKVEKKLPPPCKIRCFAAGTTVLTEQGFVAIETLEVGDVVWAYNPDTGESALKPILKTGVNTQDTIWNLSLAKGGETYRHEVTGSHPYFVPDIGWVEVAHLRVGNELLTEDGETAIVTGVFDTGQVQTTYNFEVADINTYYVSAARVLVHNCGGGDATRGLWKITKEGTASTMRHGKFGTFHKSKSDGLWWSRDQAGHGGSTWKVFEETKDGLKWRADADRFGDFIKGKHKGDVGILIPRGELAGVAK